MRLENWRSWKSRRRGMNRQRKVLVWVGVAAVVLLMTVTAWIHYRQETVLEFGMFTGSNWNVASANSFVIFDKI